MENAKPLDMQLNIQEITRLIPHRFPFLLVDKITAITKEEIIGIKNVTMNEPFFEGHFPNNPIMPGVLILEAMAQVAGVMTSYYLREEEGTLSEDQYDCYFMSVDSVNFRSPVTPGDTLTLHIKSLARRGVVRKFSGVVRVADRIVADARFTVAVVRRDGQAAVLSRLPETKSSQP